MVLTIGIAMRVALIPVTHGQDFVVWDKASAATLNGANVYLHHPGYPGGPFAYFPLFIYVELPFQWLAQHSVLSFTVYGKLPILAADIACAVLIADELRRRGHSGRAVALGVAAFFLNPLVLYNSAYYGRFDTVALALLMLAYRGLTRGPVASRWAAAWYALAVAAKTFPLFVLPGLLRGSARYRRRIALTLGVTLLALSAPYLASTPSLVHDIVFYDATKPPQALSWQYLVLRASDPALATLIGYALLAGFAASTLWLARIPDLRLRTVTTLVLFVLCSKVVLEQYLIWPLPWLVLLAYDRQPRRAHASLGLAAALTVIGLLDNESFHPLGRSSVVIELGLAAACGLYLLVVLADPVARRRHRESESADRGSSVGRHDLIRLGLSTQRPRGLRTEDKFRWSWLQRWPVASAGSTPEAGCDIAFEPDSDATAPERGGPR